LHVLIVIGISCELIYVQSNFPKKYFFSPKSLQQKKKSSLVIVLVRSGWIFQDLAGILIEKKEL
jgi:hypothetical protein